MGVGKDSRFVKQSWGHTPEIFKINRGSGVKLYAIEIAFKVKGGKLWKIEIDVSIPIFGP